MQCFQLVFCAVFWLAFCAVGCLVLTVQIVGSALGAATGLEEIFTGETKRALRRASLRRLARGTRLAARRARVPGKEADKTSGGVARAVAHSQDFS